MRPIREIALPNKREVNITMLCTFTAYPLLDIMFSYGGKILSRYKCSMHVSAASPAKLAEISNSIAMYLHTLELIQK